MAVRQLAVLRGLRYVYLVECFGKLKIGVAADPAKRLLAMQTASPFRLSLIAAFPCPGGKAVRIERRAHAALAAHRLVGEWFTCTEAEAENAVRDAFAAQKVPILTFEEVAERLAALYLQKARRRSSVGQAVAKHRMGEMLSLARAVS